MIHQNERMMKEKQKQLILNDMASDGNSTHHHLQIANRTPSLASLASTVQAIPPQEYEPSLASTVQVISPQRHRYNTPLHTEMMSPSRFESPFNNAEVGEAIVRDLDFAALQQEVREADQSAAARGYASALLPVESRNLMSPALIQQNQMQQHQQQLSVSSTALQTQGRMPTQHFNIGDDTHEEAFALQDEQVEDELARIIEEDERRQRFIASTQLADPLPIPNVPDTSNLPPVPKSIAVIESKTKTKARTTAWTQPASSAAAAASSSAGPVTPKATRRVFTPPQTVTSSPEIVPGSPETVNTSPKAKPKRKSRKG